MSEQEKYDGRWDDDFTVMFFPDPENAAAAVHHFLASYVAFESFTPDIACLTIGIDTACFCDADPIGEMTKLVGVDGFEVIQHGANP